MYWLTKFGAKGKLCTCPFSLNCPYVYFRKHGSRTIVFFSSNIKGKQLYNGMINDGPF